MSIKHLQIFVVVFQQMNITRAAEILHMTQPAVSRAIQELEKYYGIRLFERMNHRLYKTDSSINLYSRALAILELYDFMEKEIDGSNEKSNVRIGATITLGNFVLPTLVSEFKKSHPNITIRVHILNSAKIQQEILDNELDLALVEETPTSDYLSMELLTEDCLCLILPIHHPLMDKEKIMIEDLMIYPFLLREQGSAGRSYLDNVFASHGLHLDPIWESASTQALIKGVSKQIGISILPERLISQALKKNEITTRKIENESFQRKNYIIWHKQKYLTKTLLELIHLCHKHVED